MLRPLLLLFALTLPAYADEPPPQEAANLQSFAAAHPECKEWAAYKSAEGYRQWLEALSIDPPDAMPKAVRDEPRLAPLIAMPATAK